MRPTHALDVTPFRDDREEEPPPPDPGLAVTDRDVVLVDDVLFTGRTARAAIEAVLHHGRPRSIQLVALVDRGHREYPIQPDFVGLQLPTKHQERVAVEVDPELAVFLEE
jgi:pyrimidine operon attenuation protein/uracil phosphoribosyltransferase